MALRPTITVDRLADDRLSTARARAPTRATEVSSLDYFEDTNANPHAILNPTYSPNPNANGLCPAGRATLHAHAERMERQDEAISSIRGKIDRMTWLLVTTLTAAVFNLLYMVLNHR